jgi:hypothetical protein
MALDRHFTIAIQEESKGIIEQLIDDLEQESRYTFEYCDELTYTLADANWHDCIADLMAVSKKHPDTLIEVYCDSSDTNDIWKAYFLNGKMQHSPAHIMFEPFDADKLRGKDEELPEMEEPVFLTYKTVYDYLRKNGVLLESVWSIDDIDINLETYNEQNGTSHTIDDEDLKIALLDKALEAVSSEDINNAIQDELEEYFNKQ